MKWLILTVVILSNPLVPVHDHYTNTKPLAGWRCCGGDDCKKIVDRDRIKETAFAWILDDRWVFDKGQTGLPSFDGDYHACIWGGKPRCFFYPLNA